MRFIASAKPDIICCQEIKGQCDFQIPGYTQFWNPAERKNYSGTLILTTLQPLSCSIGLGIERFDKEGRLIVLEYRDYFLLNVYVPSINTYSPPERLDFRIEWDAALREFTSHLEKPAIICGDLNVAAERMDCYSEKSEPDEAMLFRSDIREGFQELLAAGFVDAYRYLYPQQEGAFTWWGPKNPDRAVNHGSRLDYFLVANALTDYIKDVKCHPKIFGSDHCPISLTLKPIIWEQDETDEELARKWGAIDWEEMEEQLLQMQRELSEAAFYRRWDQIALLRDRVIESRAAKVLAVRAVAKTNSAVGVDKIRWSTDAEKERAAQSLTVREYLPLPYRYSETSVSGKQIVDGELQRKWLDLFIPAFRDKAMLTLLSYALSPVAEATADKKSFFCRKGRSTYDAHAYLLQDLGGDDAPRYVFGGDVKLFYHNALFESLLKVIPLDRQLLTRLLAAGVVKDGELYPTDRGISYASPLSPILGNMLLDGMQTYIYDRLYPNGNVDYGDGNLIRFCDDIIVCARSRASARKIQNIVREFLASRGLILNEDKSKIVSLDEGFDFLSRHYQRRNGFLVSEPSRDAVIKAEYELKELILNYQGSLRGLICKVNDKLTGFATYYRVTDAYRDFRHIDAVTEALLLRRMIDRHPRWSEEAVKKRYWMKEDGFYVFMLPEDPSARIVRLAAVDFIVHKPCSVNFNPYLDENYFQSLKTWRNMQRASGKYKAIWRRQEGSCACCGFQMLPDQEIEVVERHIGSGARRGNLVYIHRQCAHSLYTNIGDMYQEPLDLFEFLDDIVHEPKEASPFYELTEFFRESNTLEITLRFEEIEEIMGMHLPWESTLRLFWYSDKPVMDTFEWREAGFPFHAVKPAIPDYCISQAWTSQGYKIKTLSLEKKYVVFCKTNPNSSNWTPPKWMDTKLPDKMIYKLNRYLETLRKEFGL